MRDIINIIPVDAIFCMKKSMTYSMATHCILTGGAIVSSISCGSVAFIACAVSVLADHLISNCFHIKDISWYQDYVKECFIYYFAKISLRCIFNVNIHLTAIFIIKILFDFFNDNLEKKRMLNEPKFIILI